MACTKRRAATGRLTPHLHITYLRDQDPEPLLGDPTLATLAVLARAADTDERAKILAALVDEQPDQH